MHIENVENVIEKTRYRKESSERINKELRFDDRKLRRTSSKDRKSDTIYAILSASIRIRIRKCQTRRSEF